MDYEKEIKKLIVWRSFEPVRTPIRVRRVPGGVLLTELKTSTTRVDGNHCHNLSPSVSTSIALSTTKIDLPDDYFDDWETD